MPIVIKVGVYKSKILYNGGHLPYHLNNILDNKYVIRYYDNSNMYKRFAKTPPKLITIPLYTDGKFYSGLYKLIKKDLEELGYEVQVEFDDEFYHPNVKEGWQRIKDGLKFKLRDYQLRAIKRAIKKPFTMISLPTGSGKSIVISALLLADNVSSIIVVQAKSLMYQLAKDIEAATNIRCGIVGDGKFMPSWWTVATIQSLRTDKGLKLVKETGALYFDEAHRIGADSYKYVVDKAGYGVKIRRGFSATTFRTDTRDFLLPALTGPIVIDLDTSSLIKKGWLAKPTIIMPKIVTPKVSGSYKTMYRKAIIENEFRNDFAIRAAMRAIDNEQKIYILVRDVQKHLPLIQTKLLKKLHPDIMAVIHGKVPANRRAELLQQFKDGDKLILLASIGTMGEGIDLPGDTKIGVNLAGGSSDIAVQQSLGRLLRKPKLSNGDVDHKQVYKVTYIDFLDYTSELFMKQSKKRRAIYASEPAFNIVEI